MGVTYGKWWDLEGVFSEDAFDVAVAYTKSVELVGQKEEYRGEEGINMCKAIQDLMGSSSHDRIQDMVKAAEDEQYWQKLFRELDEGQE